MVPWVSSFVVVAVVFLWLYHPQLGVLNDFSCASARRAADRLARLPRRWRRSRSSLPTPGNSSRSSRSPSLRASRTYPGIWWSRPRPTAPPAFRPALGDRSDARTIDRHRRALVDHLGVQRLYAAHHHDRRRAAAGHRGDRALHLQGRFDAFNFGMAAAASLLLFVVILVITLLYLRVADPVQSGGEQ